MCGNCCKLYSVVIDFPEWLQIVKYFGVETTSAGLNRFYIKRGSDGFCPFICNFANSCLCALQNMKPDACKQWPFKVLSEPAFGDAKHALYSYEGLKLFVYADSTCSGLGYGSPRWEFTALTLKEFVELTLGKRQMQCKTTRLQKPF
jgi:Fe-S-cluster containining protein